MPAVPAKSSSAKKGAEEPSAKKKKELPKELCGCGVDTYRAPPKGKKLTTAPVEHNAGCQYQRTTCDAYPHLPRCEVCQHPCAYCGGKNRWCPHCYEMQCEHRYKRVVHGWAPPSMDAGPGSPATAAASISAITGRSGGGIAGASSSAAGRRSTVTFTADGGGAGAAAAANSTTRTKKSSVSFAPTAN